MTTTEAVEIKEERKSIEVLAGMAAVEVTQVHEENWNDFTNPFPVEVSLRNSQNQEIKQIEAGKRLDLVVSLPNGYKAGRRSGSYCATSLFSLDSGRRKGENFQSGF